jgi:hypothetical protein
MAQLFGVPGAARALWASMGGGDRLSSRHASRRPTQQSAVDADGSRVDHDLSPVMERTRQRCGPNRCGEARSPSTVTDPTRKIVGRETVVDRGNGQVMVGVGVTSKRASKARARCSARSGGDGRSKNR